MRAARGERVQAAFCAPGQVAAQVGLGVIPGGALETGQVRRDRQPQLISERRQRIRREGRQVGEGPHAQTLRLNPRREAQKVPSAAEARIPASPNRECLCALSAWRSACSAGTDCAGHVDEAFSDVRAVRDRIGQGEDFTGYGPALADFVRSLHALWAATPNDLGIPAGIPQIPLRAPAQRAPRMPRNRIRRDDRHSGSRITRLAAFSIPFEWCRRLAGLNKLASGSKCSCRPSAIWLTLRWRKRPPQAHRPQPGRDRRVGMADGHRHRATPSQSCMASVKNSGGACRS